MQAQELEYLTERLLERGVPPVVVADALELDLALVKTTLSAVRVSRFGTDDLDEFLAMAEWDAIAQVRQLILTGSAAQKEKYALAVLGKKQSAVARREPEGKTASKAKTEEMFAQMRGDGAG